MFINTKQSPEDQYSNFVNVLKELAIQCQFGSLANRMIRDSFIAG